METIKIDAYTFEELDDAARARVFEDWKQSEDITFYREMDEGDLYNALAGIRAALKMDRSGSAWFDDYSGAVEFRGCYTEEADAATHRLPEFGTTGDCYGYDLAEAFNRHADALENLADAFDAVSTAFANYEDGAAGDHISRAVDDIAAAFAAEFDAAMDDVAAEYNRLLESIDDYYTGDETLAEFWDSYAAESYTDGRVFDSDGRDISALLAVFGK